MYTLYSSNYDAQKAVSALIAETVNTNKIVNIIDPHYLVVTKVNQEQLAKWRGQPYDEKLYQWRGEPLRGLIVQIMSEDDIQTHSFAWELE